jgi:O-antigen/teichoic acid export membrane protein
LNGLQQIRDYIKINIIQSLVTLVITLLLINFLRIEGVLIALVINQSIVFFLLILLLRNHSYLNSNLLRYPFDKYEVKKLFKFSLMTVTSSIITPISLIIIRNEIQFKFNLEAAGHWQALWYISTMHLMVITTTLSIYYLPKLSSIKEKRFLREEILNGYKIIFPMIIISSFSIFLLKDIIVDLLFSKDFEIIKDLLMYQLIGDVLKIISWLLSYLMIAKAMAKSFIFTEILFVIIFVLLAIYFMNINGLIGLTYAYIVNYILYTVTMIIMFRKILFYNASAHDNNTII